MTFITPLVGLTPPPLISYRSYLFLGHMLVELEHSVPLDIKHFLEIRLWLFLNDDTGWCFTMILLSKISKYYCNTCLKRDS